MPFVNPYSANADDDSDDSYAGGYEPRRKVKKVPKLSVKNPQSDKSNVFQFTMATSAFDKLSPFRLNKQHVSFHDSFDDERGYEPRRKVNAAAITSEKSPQSDKSSVLQLLTATTTSVFGKLGTIRRNNQQEAFQDSSGDEWSDEEEEQDASELLNSKSLQKMVSSVRPKRRSVEEYSIGAVPPPPGFIDPWEVPARETENGDESELAVASHSGEGPVNATFLTPSDIHPNMISREEDVAQLRLLAGKLSADWKGQDFMAPALARRIRDFQFAQDKRRRKYGDERPWGILGLYDHLAAIRVDVEWAEDAAWRRANGEPYLSWADFNASKREGLNRPFFTYFLLFTCTVTLITSFALNGWTVEPLDVNPMIGPSSDTLIKMGAKESYLIVHDNEAWRLVSSIILHAGLVHYFVNMMALWFVGSAIEQCHGTIASTILFVIPAIGGTILSAIFLPEYITVGASGGIFGLIGACLSDIIMNWKLLFCDFVTENGKKHRHVMVVVFLLLDIVLNCIIGLTPYVDNFTHLGGMAYGFLSGLSTMERLSHDFFGLEQSCFAKTKQIFVRFFGLIVSVIGVLVATIILLEGDGTTNPCPQCTWLSCVPFPPWEGATNKWWYCDDCERITADIVREPSLHLDLHCPDGTSATVGLDPDEEINRDKIVKELPKYCREHCLSND